MADFNALASGMSRYARSITYICSLIAFVKHRWWTTSSQASENRKQALFAQYEELMTNFQSLGGVIEGLKEEVQIKKSLVSKILRYVRKSWTESAQLDCPSDSP